MENTNELLVLDDRCLEGNHKWQYVGGYRFKNDGPQASKESRQFQCVVGGERLSIDTPAL